MLNLINRITVVTELLAEGTEPKMFTNQSELLKIVLDKGAGRCVNNTGCRESMIHYINRFVELARVFPYAPIYTNIYLKYVSHTKASLARFTTRCRRLGFGGWVTLEEVTKDGVAGEAVRIRFKTDNAKTVVLSAMVWLLEQETLYKAFTNGRVVEMSAINNSIDALLESTFTEDVYKLLTACFLFLRTYGDGFLEIEVNGPVNYMNYYGTKYRWSCFFKAFPKAIPLAKSILASFIINETQKILITAALQDLKEL